MTGSNKPKLDILASYAAIGDRSAISVNVALAALDRRGANEIVERHRGDLSAAIDFARGVKAGLPFLRGVYAVKPDALAVNFYRVAVEDRCAANNLGESDA